MTRSDSDTATWTNQAFYPLPGTALEQSYPNPFPHKSASLLHSAGSDYAAAVCPGWSRPRQPEHSGDLRTPRDMWPLQLKTQHPQARS